MKKNIVYYFLCAVVATALVSCGQRNPLPSLTETYSRTDKNPFGTYVAFRQVNELFYRNDVRVKKVAVDKIFDDNYSDTSSLYISISEHFYLRRTELVSLLNYVNRGNNVFVSARYFDSSFLREMDVSVRKPDAFNFVSSMDMKKTTVQLPSPPYADNGVFSYYYLPFKNSFTIKVTDYAPQVLGVNEKGDPNFVVLFHGKGRVYLHCEPRVFSNYFLLKENNYKYLQRAFSFMPRIPDNIFWDDFYNRRYNPPKENDNAKDDDSGNKSGLSVLFKYPAMKWAFLISLLLLLLYILFGSKRRQRIVKTIAATENTSVAFTETVGRLYLQKKDNRNIADKMITYLLEHIRNQYFLSTNNLNDEFTAMLSRKSNLPYDQTEVLMGLVKRVQRYDDVDDALLLSLNTQIENFYKHK